MSEFIRNKDLMPEKFERRTFNIQEGPALLALSVHPIGVVIPERDLGEAESSGGCRIIDLLNYDPKEGTGFIDIADGQKITLGRAKAYRHSRFSFLPDVSSRHATFERQGSEVTVEDVGSRNGTSELVKRESGGSNDAVPEQREEIVKAAAFSVASARHDERNDDSYLFSKEGQFVGVFDGMGGLSGSDKASRLAAETAADYLRKRSPAKVPEVEMAHMAVHWALWEAHGAIKQNSQLKNVGTTGAVVKVFEVENRGWRAAIAHSGDSRVYLFRDSKLTHLTLDHGYRPSGYSDEEAMHLQEMVANATDISKLGADAQEVQRFSDRITSYLGGEENPKIDTKDVEARVGDKFIAMTDGIYGNLKTEEIEDILKEHDSADLAVQALVKAAQERRRIADDMTAAMIIV
jgi:serine/threonine protein phosphatase PrpC